MLGVKCKVTNLDVVKAGYDAEVLTVPGGDNVIRLLPPLNISDSEIDEAVARVDAAAIAVEAVLDVADLARRDVNFEHIKSWESQAAT